MSPQASESKRTRALVHIDPATKRVVGVWIKKSDLPTSYYSEADGGSEYQRQLGTSTMKRQIRGTWDMWCEHLSAKTPTDAWWETTEVDSAMTLQEIFDSVRS